MRTLAGAFTLAILLMTGGAVARQALDMRAGTFNEWTCPACGTGNAAVRGEEANVVCCHCHARYEWWDVLSPLTGERGR